jgi:hypothetical protein
VLELKDARGYEDAAVAEYDLSFKRDHEPRVLVQRCVKEPVPENSSVKARAGETAESTIPGIID